MLSVVPVKKVAHWDEGNTEPYKEPHKALGLAVNAYEEIYAESVVSEPRRWMCLVLGDGSPKTFRWHSSCLMPSKFCSIDIRFEISNRDAKPRREIRL